THVSYWREPAAAPVLTLVLHPVALALLAGCIVGVVGGLPERVGDDRVVVLVGNAAIGLVTDRLRVVGHLRRPQHCPGLHLPGYAPDRRDSQDVGADQRERRLRAPGRPDHDRTVRCVEPRVVAAGASTSS